jgi:hypothetical protein
MELDNALRWRVSRFLSIDRLSTLHCIQFIGTPLETHNFYVLAYILFQADQEAFEAANTACIVSLNSLLKEEIGLWRRRLEVAQAFEHARSLCNGVSASSWAALTLL